MPLVDRHETMGRASYCETDSYAPKASRLSEIAPRPNLEDDGKRRSKRRKIRPLQYWRGERIEYARAPSAAVPEGVSLPAWTRVRLSPLALFKLCLPSACTRSLMICCVSCVQLSTSLSARPRPRRGAASLPSPSSPLTCRVRDPRALIARSLRSPWLAHLDCKLRARVPHEASSCFSCLPDRSVLVCLILLASSSVISVLVCLISLARLPSRSRGAYNPLSL